MAEGSLLGVSVLELRTDSAPLTAGLATARREVDASTLGMQTAVDRRMTSMHQSFRGAASSATSSMGSMSTATGELRRNVESSAVAERTFQAEMARGNTARRAASAETRTLAAETGVSSRAMKDLYSQMGPVGTALGDLTTRSRLYREHGIDYLSAGVLGLEAGFVAMSVHAAMSFEELSNTVAKQTGLSGRSLDDLLGTIRRVGRDSPYQMSQVSAAAVILRQSFHESDAQIGRTANLMVAFANAAGQDVTPQMQQLSRIMHDYREPLSHVVTLTDQLVSVSQATQQPLGEFTSALDRFGPRFQALGLNLHDSIRLLGLFAASGVPIAQMGRGITAALTNVTKTTQDGSGKLETYRIAVQSAQLRVDNLSRSLASGKGDQQKLNAEMQIAQGHLTVAKDKYDALNRTLVVAKGAHGNVTTAIQGEIAQIVNAHSKQDALNIAIQDFGKNLGPSMARAFYNNKTALEEVDRALGKTGATQRLFQVDSHSLNGEMQRAKNNFQDLEIAVGTKLVPALSKGVDWLRNTIHSIDDFAKHHKDLLEIAGGITGIGAALTLLSRHSPLGDILGRLFADSGHTGIASFLSGKSGGGTWGLKGPTAGGSVANPVAVFVTNSGGVGGGGSGPGGALTQAERDAQNAEKGGLKNWIVRGAGEGALGAEAISMPQATAAVAVGAGTLFLSAAAFRDALGRYAHPYDTPTARQNLSAFGPKDPNTHDFIPVKTARGATQLSAGGSVGPKVDAAAIERANRDFLQMNTQLVRLGSHQQSIKSTAFNLDYLAAQAKKAGDVRWQFADRLGAEMLRSRSVTSAGVRNLVADLGKLTPGARKAAQDSMLQMARELETAGRVPVGSTAKLVTEMLANYKSGKDKGGVIFHDLMVQAAATMEELRKKVATSSGKTRDEALAAEHDLQRKTASTFSAMEQDVAAKQEAMRHAIASGSQKAANQAGTNLYAYEQNVYGAMNKGLLTSSQGADLITRALNATLKAFGSKPIPMPTSVSGLSAPGKPLHAGTVAATGALIQVGRDGAAGRDTIPLSVGGPAGHADIVVGEGEKLAVINRHQAPDFDRRFADYGGLQGYFAKNKKPHYLASGGVVPQFAGGGFVSTAYGPPWGGIEGGGTTATGIDLHGSPHDYIIAVDPSVIPLHSQVKVWPNPFGYTGTFAAEDTGGAIKGNRIDFYDWLGRAAQNAWGVRNVTAQILGKAVAGTASGSAMAAAFQQIAAPTVGGTGTVADLVRHALGKEAAAANAYERSHMPAPAAGGVGGGSAVPGGAGTVPDPSGKPVAAWIEPILQWARAHGWGGSVTSGWRSDAEQKRIYDSGIRPAAVPISEGGSGSNHEFTQFPGGAVDVSDAAQLSSILSHSPYGQTLVWAGSKDPVHFSHPHNGSYARGGLVDLLQRFAAGGWVRTGATVDNFSGGPMASGFSTSYNAGNTFAELNITPRRHPLLGELLGHGGPLPFGFPIDIRAGGRELDDVRKIDTGHGQPNTWYTTDIEIPAARRLGWGLNSSGAVDVRAHSAQAGSPAHKASLKQKPKKAAAPKPTPLPKLPGSAFNPALVNALQTDADTVTRLQGWQSYLSTLNTSGPSLTPLVTLADGSEVINWDGMIDPSSGQHVKGINQRLAEIGVEPGTTPASAGLLQRRDTSTELGIENEILDALLHQQADAQVANGGYWQWLTQMQGYETLDTKQVAWLKQALDNVLPEPALEHTFDDLGGFKIDEAARVGFGTLLASQHPWINKMPGRYEVDRKWSSVIMEKVRAFRDAAAQEARLAAFKDQLPAERERRTRQIQHDFAVRRHQLENASATSTFTSSEILQGSLHDLSRQKAGELARIKKPANWKGSSKGWAAQASTERQLLADEFTARERALRDAAGKAGLTARLRKGDALFNLGLQESDELAVIRDKFSGKSGDYQGQITALRTGASSARKWLTDLKGAISGNKTTLSGDLSASKDLTNNLADMVDPMGSLSIAIDTARNVRSEPSIPGYWDEIGQLKGTAPPASSTSGSGSATDSQLAGLLEQQLAQTSEALAVSQAQYGVLSHLGDLPPFGGSFATGGTVPGPIGAARTVIAHGGEKITPAGGGDHTFHVVVQDGAVNAERIKVIANGEAQKVTRGAATIAGRSLPSRGGGQLIAGRR